MAFKRKKIFGVLLAGTVTIFLFIGCSNLNSKSSKVVFNNLKKETVVTNMTNTISELSSEKYNGRLAGSIENEKAAEYIAAHFKSIGLESPVRFNNYMQAYVQNTIKMNNKPSMRIVDSSNKDIREFHYLDNFYVVVGSGLKIKGDVSGSLYYASDFDTLRPDNKELENKVVLISKDIYGKLMMNRGVDGLLRDIPSIKAVVCERDKNDPIQSETGYFMNPTHVPSPIIVNNNGAFMAISDSPTFHMLKEAAVEKQTLRIEADYDIEKKRVANVIGLIPGSDPRLKDEYIIISGHFDHIGSNLNGTYNPGAFDNASGVSVMMEAARALKAKNVKPKKSILFVAFNGEENGLYGSRYFAENPIIDLRKSVMINLDMVAHKKENPLTFYFSNESNLISDLSDYAAELKINYQKKNGNRSDHAPIDVAGGQSVTLIEWEMKGGYHSPKDTADMIDTIEIEKVIQFVMYYISKKAF